MTLNISADYITFVICRIRGQSRDKWNEDTMRKIKKNRILDGRERRTSRSENMKTELDMNIHNLVSGKQTLIWRNLLIKSLGEKP